MFLRLLLLVLSPRRLHNIAGVCVCGDVSIDVVQFMGILQKQGVFTA